VADYRRRRRRRRRSAHLAEGRCSAARGRRARRASGTEARLDPVEVTADRLGREGVRLALAAIDRESLGEQPPMLAREAGERPLAPAQLRVRDGRIRDRRPDPCWGQDRVEQRRPFPTPGEIRSRRLEVVLGRNGRQNALRCATSSCLARLTDAFGIAYETLHPEHAHPTDEACRALELIRPPQLSAASMDGGIPNATKSAGRSTSLSASGTPSSSSACSSRASPTGCSAPQLERRCARAPRAEQRERTRVCGDRRSG
jgi:hypothetical protein